MSGPWENLRRSGALDSAAVELFYEAVDAVRRFDRFPPPEGAGSWTADAVAEMAHQFLYGEGGPERLAKLVATATDEASFERLVEAAVRNEFRLQARQSDTGAALRALTHAVEQDQTIVIAGATPTTRTWSLASHQGSLPYSGSVGPLIDAAYAVPEVRAARWSPDSRRRAPIAEPESLRRVLRAVLTEAGAPLSPRQMLEVVLARFPLITTERTEFDAANLTGHVSSPDAALLAAEVWEQLSDNERLVAGVLDLPVRDMANATGLSRSTASRAAAAARQVLSAYLRDVDDPATVVAALAAASAAARERGTMRAGSASTSSEPR